MATNSNTVEQSRPPLPIRLLNSFGRATARLGLDRNPFRAADLIETAKRRTGLDDFGGGEFFEPLSRLLEACHTEARLNVIGRIALKCDVVRTLENRLLIEHDRKVHSQIASQEIREPLFIVGLPRSGTTLLHLLLAVDPAHRVPLTWEVRSPSPPNDVDAASRIGRAARELSSFRWLAPTFEAVHPMGAESAQECISLMGPTFLSDQFDSMYNVPSYRSWYLKQSLLSSYKYHYRFLQHLQQRKNDSRWVLKAPTHMFGASALLSTYPDARFVQMHRDPVEAIASVSSLLVILRSVFSDAVDPIQIGRDAVYYWMEAIRRFVSERERLPSDRVLDLHHSALQKDPMGGVQRVYQHFGWTLSPKVEQQMKELLAQLDADRKKSHRYDSSQFGLTNIEEFDAYRERFGLKPPSSGSRRERVTYTREVQESDRPKAGGHNGNTDESAFIA